MESRTLGIIFRISGILTIACAICMFFVEINSPEFYITIISLLVSFITSIASGIMFYKKRKKEEEEE